MQAIDFICPRAGVGREGIQLTVNNWPIHDSTENAENYPQVVGARSSTLHPTGRWDSGSGVEGWKECNVAATG